LEKGCDDNYKPLCPYCKFSTHKQNKHDIKPLRMIMKDLTDQLDFLTSEYEAYKSDEDTVE